MIRIDQDGANGPGGGLPRNGTPGNSGVVPPGLGQSPTAAQYTGATGGPLPAAPKPPTSVNPALHVTATPAGPGTGGPAQALLTPINTTSNPATHQTAPVIGTPQGYPIGQGVDTSFSGLLPNGFDIGDLTAPAIPDATTPGSGSYVQQGASQQQGTTPWTVAPNQTVQGQFAGLMEKGNPAIQAVEEQTLRAHAASGGRNDLMAQSAATLTGSQVAMTIAAQDAATYAAAGQFNANAANTFAQQMNQFVDNAVLSSQNFQQGVAMLKDQSHQQIEQLYAQVQANAATQSTNLKSTLDTLQAQTNATLEQMDKQFSQSAATLGLQNQYANDQAWQEYGRQVRMGYLASVNTNQNTLMQTIGEIRSNPNITTTQAASAVKDAIDQFNAYMTMNNAYYGAMVPGGTPGATPGAGAPPPVAYNSAAYDYSHA